MWNVECGMWNEKLPAAVIFDMDGVLADTEPIHGDCFVRAFRHLGIETTLEDYRQAVTLGGSPVKDFYISLGGAAHDWDRVKAIKDQTIQAALAGNGTLMPGVVRLLRELRSESIPMSVATSARRRSLEFVMDRFSLWPYFGCSATKDEVDAEKPDPAVLLLAAECLEVKPARCVVVEDSPRGVLAAHRAGMKCVAVPTRSTAEGDFSLAALVVPSLRNVNVRVLEGLFGQ